MAGDLASLVNTNSREGTTNAECSNPARVAARTHREDMLRFEGEGGRIMPEQRTGHNRPDAATWKQIVLAYQSASTGRALWQTVNTLGPYALLWYLMYLSLSVSWWLAVPLAVLAAAFHVRVFIIHH